MASIIKAMCNSVGIENVKLTWIGTREIPYTYEEMPTPGVDNHMIACYIKGEEYIFLDATDAMTKYPLPSSFIQGKDALVGIDENNFEIIKVPIVQGKENENKIEIACSREGNKMTGSASMSYSGLSRTSQVYRVSSIDEKRKFSNVKRSVILGNNKFILKDYKERNSEDRDLPYIIDFDFEIGNYAVEIGKEHFVNLFLKSHGILYELEDDRKTPYEIDKNQYINASVVYKLKDGEKATELPEAIDINNDLVSFQAKYVSENNEIKLNYTLETKKLLLLLEDFTQWNDSIESIKDYMENTLSIKQN
jgi:hypothetical protein